MAGIKGSGRVLTCPSCGKEFYRRLSMIVRGARFCSKRCWGDYFSHTPEKSEAVFWSRVDKNGPNGCWNWTACTNERGYGMTSWAGEKNIRAHRKAYELLRGPIPEGMFCLHKCDNRRCVNPDHIFFGLYKENALDCKAKGRNTAKLTDAQVEALRREFRQYGHRQSNAKELCAKYGIGYSWLRQIVRGRKRTTLLHDIGSSAQ